MPNITIPIRDIHNSIERPVLLTIIRQIMDITQISSKTPISFFGTEGKASQQKSSLDNDPAIENKWGYDERVFIEIDEDYNPDRVLSTVVTRPEQRFIFVDQDLGVFIKPVYSNSKVTITFKYRSRDKNQANMWRNNIRTHTSMMRDLNLHTVDYSYHLQEEYLILLKEIHRLREAQGGYDETFNDYFTRKVVTNASTVTNLAGTASTIAISERQNRIQGSFDFEGFPEKGDRDEEHDAWVISFNYVFTYEKAIETNIHYPILIHNQVLNQQFRPNPAPYTLEAQKTYYNQSGLAMAYFESDQRALRVKINDGVTLPSYDEFRPNSVLPSSIKVLTALSTITETDKRNLFNLKDLGDISFIPEIIDFITQSEFPYMGIDFGSIICLSLYRNGRLLESKSLIVTNDLDIKATFDLDIRKTYHVRLGLITDFSFLSMDAIRRLQNFPLVAGKIINAINAAIRSLSNRPDIGRNKLSLDDENLLLGNLAADFQRNLRLKLVQQLFIVALENKFTEKRG